MLVKFSNISLPSQEILHMKKLLFSFIVYTFGMYALPAQTTYLHCGQVIDGVSNQVHQEKTIIIENGLIKAIESGYSLVPDTAIGIDLKDQTISPGWMDMHVHMEGEIGPKRYEEGFRMNQADVALRATMYAKKTLMAGFTTVRDLGGSGANVSLRNAINRGYVVGPRIFTAEKSIATTGGHADPTNGVRDDLKGDPGPKEGVINGPEDAYKAIRQRYKNGADVIKITATGGVLSVAKDGQGPQFTVEEVKAIVAAANDYGMVAAAHAHGDEGMKRAVIGGIHSIEHGTFMNEEVRNLMVKHGTYLVPTLSAGEAAMEKAKIRGFFPPIILKKVYATGKRGKESFRKAYEAGVNIAFGTDAGVCPHGDNAKEFIYMTESGMPAMKAIQSATMEAAKLLRIQDTHGSIEKGKVADIIGLDGNPLEDIEAVLSVNFVMKDGKVFKNE